MRGYAILQREEEYYQKRNSKKIRGWETNGLGDTQIILGKTSRVIVRAQSEQPPFNIGK